MESRPNFLSILFLPRYRQRVKPYKMEYKKGTKSGTGTEKK